MREEGYYWVKSDGEWEIGYFSRAVPGYPSHWSLPSSINYNDLVDSDFEEIDEKRLTHE